MKVVHTEVTPKTWLLIMDDLLSLKPVQVENEENRAERRGEGIELEVARVRDTYETRVFAELNAASEAHVDEVDEVRQEEGWSAEELIVARKNQPLFQLLEIICFYHHPHLLTLSPLHHLPLSNSLTTSSSFPTLSTINLSMNHAGSWCSATKKSLNTKVTSRFHPPNIISRLLLKPA